jgi:hypothetical protein
VSTRLEEDGSLDNPHTCAELQCFETMLTSIEEIYVPNQLLKTTLINDIVRQKPK